MDEDKRAESSNPDMDMGPVITFSIFLLVLVSAAGIFFELYYLFCLVPFIIAPIPIMSYSRRRVLEGKAPILSSIAAKRTTNQAAAITPGHHGQQQIKVLDRKKPETGFIVLWKLVSGSVSLIMGGLIAWFSIDFEDTIFGIGLAIYGLYEIYTGLAAILSSKSNHNIYRRGSELVDARVTAKTIDKAAIPWLSGSEKNT